MTNHSNDVDMHCVPWRFEFAAIQRAVRTGLAIHTNANACPVTSGISKPLSIFIAPVWGAEILEKQAMLPVIAGVKNDAVVRGCRDPAWLVLIVDRDA